MNNLLNGVTINFHSSICINKNNIKIYIDPYKIVNYLNDANYIFITHNHYDHYSKEDIYKVINSNTILIAPYSMKDELNYFENEIIFVIPNNNYNINNLSFHAVGAYNVDKKYHPKSNNWVGYNILIDNNYYYITGDSDLTSEALKEKCDVMFVPVGGTYTMDYKQAATLANKKELKYVIPTHYGIVGDKNDAIKFINLLKNKEKGKILV